MKSASAPLIAHLAGNNQFAMADLYTLVLTGGTTYRFTSYDATLTDGTNTWASGGPVLARDKVRSVIGLEVDTMTIHVSPKDTDLLGALTWFQAAAAGVLDGATLTLQRAFLTGGTTLVGTIKMFVGTVAQLTLDRMTLELTVNSPIDLLSIQMPRNLYQAGCQHTVYDAGCTLNRATYAVAGSISGSPTLTSFACYLPQPTGYYDLGSIQFTSGANSGLKRTIKHWDGATLTLLNPLPATPSAGDGFTLAPGCDKTQVTCGSKFSNVVNFKGMPYVPVPETAY